MKALPLYMYSFHPLFGSQARKGHRQLVTHVSALACAAPGESEAEFIDIAYGVGYIYCITCSC